MIAKIKKSKYGLMYQLDNDRGFTYFPDAVSTPEQMKAYFRNGGHQGIKGTFDEPDLQFVSDSGQPAVAYTVIKDKTFIGQRYAIVNHDENKKFVFPDAVTDAEKLDFLKSYSTRLQDNEADKFATDQERIKYYLGNCAESTKAEYNEFIHSALTPEKIRDICEANAKTYDPSFCATVEFTE